MKWFVSRQAYWGMEPDKQNVVEIAAGGLDYANPDMLGAKYRGEMREYTSAREAVEAALSIRDAWRRDEPHKVITVARGFTGGCTMPFEADEDDDALRAWAEKQEDKDE